MPCLACPMNPCQRKRDVQAGVQGLPVTSVRIKCRDYNTMFAKGQRVYVNVPYSKPSDSGWGDLEDAECAGTILGMSGHRWLVLLDPEEVDDLENLQNKAGIIKARPSAISQNDDGRDPIDAARRLAKYDSPEWTDPEVIEKRAQEMFT